MSELRKNETGSKIAMPWPPSLKMDMTYYGWFYLHEIWRADAEEGHWEFPCL